MDDADLPEGWTVWNDDPDGRSVLVYRPDVFDTEAYPAPCLPTLYVSRRAPQQRRRRYADPGDTWYVAFYLEPEVRVRDCDAARESRMAALEAAVDVARAFVDGEVDYRGAYQLPREAYLDRLDDLVGDAGSNAHGADEGDDAGA